ncbi:MAG: efflux RND transporter periplasmic adaptor subunit [Acidobacteria bacterium]|nr:efflux RND transporter periplasmic adaptor subunit [Acidobacteriota bacterium]
MKRKQKFALVGGGVAVLVLFSVAMASRGEKGQAVQVAKVDRQDLQAKVSANGKIQAVTKADISANLVGQVTRLAVREGDSVKKGQFLMEIDPRNARANSEAMEANMRAAQSDYASARATLAQVRSDFERSQANHKAGIISAAEFEKARTALETAKASEESSRRRAEQAQATRNQSKVGLAYTTITSPIDGVVTARRIELGETAVPGIQNQAGTVLLTISDMSRIEAEMEVDEASIPNVKVDQEAQVRIDAYPNQLFQGIVTEVGGSPILKLSQNEATKFKVKVRIKNPPLTIKPGLSAQADIFTGRREKALAVPFQAIVMRDIKRKPGDGTAPGAPKEEEGVYLMDNGKAKFAPVKTGMIGDLSVEVLGGLNGGESLITGPNRILRELKDGDPVHVDKKAKKDGKGEKKG